MQFGLSDGVSPEKIREATVDAADRAAREFGTRYYLKTIGYIPNDSRHYRLHGRCVWEIIRHLSEGGHFRVLPEPE